MKWHHEFHDFNNSRLFPILTERSKKQFWRRVGAIDKYVARSHLSKSDEYC